MIIGIITNALYAKFATEVKQIEEQVQLKQIMSDSSYTGSIYDLLGFDSDYNNKLIVQEGNLVYVSDEVSSQEVKWLEKLGIEKASDYFTVEFDSAGGTEINSQSIRTGNLVKKPSNPIKSGHDFLGWYYLKESGSEDNPTYTEIEFDFNTQITNNYSLYAKYSGEAIMMARNDSKSFWTTQYRTKITNIVFQKREIIIPDGAIDLGSIKANDECAEIDAYLEDDGSENNTYKLTIISPNTIYANVNATKYFANFDKLESVDFSNFDTSKTISLNMMFYKCTKLNSLNLNEFNTDNVINMGGLFDNCTNLVTLSLDNFNTSKVINMYCMFNVCSNLTSLDLSNFKTSNVSSMGYMFNGCKSLTYLDLKNFDTSKVSNMYMMFYNCSNLTFLDISNFNTSNVTNMQYLFYGCGSLETLDLKSFNTQNITNMQGLFGGCGNLKSLDLSNFDTTNVTNMSGMT